MKTRSNPRQSIFLGLLSKIQEENEHLQNSPKSVKTVDYTRCFWVEFGSFLSISKTCSLDSKPH